MAEFLHPGVFVEETSFRAKPIDGVPTGTAGFVRADTAGPAVSGPFADTAAFEQQHFQWDAARAFFEEGGKRLFVAHAATDDAAGLSAALASLTDADIVAAPGLTAPHVAPALIAHAETHRRFAVIDPPPGLDVAGVRAFRAGLDTSHAALYWPWVVTPAGVQPPSPHIAGIVARTDVERGVWKPPSNEVVRGASGFERDITTAEQEVLNPLGINCLRSFEGRGHRVWGARTLSSHPEHKYINLRRQLDWLICSLTAGLAWTVFEPNVGPLWSTVRNAVAVFLYTHWRAGGLVGAKSEQAFYVLCDRTTMTQDDIDNGRLIVMIGIAPLRPAEFVIFRIELRTAAQSA